MTLEFVTEYLDEKIDNNKEYVVCPVYDLRVNHGVLQQEVDEFLKYAKIRLENLGYQVYFTGAKFKYKDKTRIVTDNYYLIAIKELERKV